MEVRGQNGGTMDKIEVPSQMWLKWRYHGQNGGTMNKMEVPLIKWRYNGQNGGTMAEIKIKLLQRLFWQEVTYYEA